MRPVRTCGLSCGHMLKNPPPPKCHTTSWGYSVERTFRSIVWTFSHGSYRSRQKKILWGVWFLSLRMLTIVLLITCFGGFAPWIHAGIAFLFFFFQSGTKTKLQRSSRRYRYLGVGQSWFLLSALRPFLLIALLPHGVGPAVSPIES